MGSLYLARDPGLDRLVAIKLLREDFQDDREIRQRFQREARAVARLRHPNIIVVFDVGEEDGRPFIAMEYIDGPTLADLLDRTPPLPLPRRLEIVEGLCAGLAHAHAAGIVHRDVKPANIMVDADGVVKILDFGIARQGNTGTTQAGIMLGSLNYMSPEQMLGREVDGRTDIFAAGAVLYEAIALEQAFPGGMDSGVFHAIMHSGPVPLPERVRGVDRELAAVVERALSREPAERYQDAQQMRRDLERVRTRLVSEHPPLPSELIEALQDPTKTAVARRPASTREGVEPTRVAARPASQPAAAAVSPPLTSGSGRDAEKDPGSRARFVYVFGTSVLAIAAIVGAMSLMDWGAREAPAESARAAPPASSPDTSSPPATSPDTRAAAAQPAEPPPRAEPRSSPPEVTKPAPEPVAAPKTPEVNRTTVNEGAGFRRRARQALANGNAPEALDAILSALRVAANDRAARSMLVSMANDAKLSSQRAKDDAVAKYPAVSADATYKASLGFETAAERELAGGRVHNAVRMWWSARDGFREAAAAQAKQAAASPPATSQSQVGAAKPADAQAAIPTFEQQQRKSELPGILATLRAYATAWNNLDLDGIRRTQELMGDDLAAVRRTIDGAREYVVALTVQQVTFDRDGRHAAVTAEVRRRLVPKRGEPSESTTRTIFTFEKRVGGWIIIGVN
jgi:eukaryotic-like serine/threonine-protein kinase